MRSSALTLAVGYISLGLAALALFAAPLWYAWRVTIQDGRAEILQADAQRLTDVFRREGAAGLISYIDARVGLQIAGERFLLLADAALQAAGRQSDAPGRPTCRPSPAPTPSRSSLGSTSPTSPSCMWRCRAATTCWSGRDLARYRAAGAALLVRAGRRGRHPVGLRRARRHPDPARADGAHPRHPPDRVGDHAGRPEPPAADQSTAAMSSTRCRRPSTACSSRSSS